MKSSKKANRMAISNLSDDIYEAEKVLLYSLHLPKYNLPPHSTQKIESDFSTIVESITMELLNNFKNIFNVGDCNFFGHKNMYSQESKDCEDLSLLQYHPNLWSHIFKQDAIIFCFVQLRKMLGESYLTASPERVYLSNYTISNNDILEESFDKCHHGFDFITTLPRNGSFSSIELTVENSTPIISVPSKNKHNGFNDPLIFNSNAPNYIRRIKSLNRQIEKAGLNTKALYSTNVTLGDEEKNLSLNTFEFYDFLVSRKTYGENISPILNAYHATKENFTYSKYEKYIAAVRKVLSSINANFIDIDLDKSNVEHNLTNSDKIYLRYQIEKIFAPATINCLYQNIIPTKGTAFSLYGQDAINLLSACSRLPNVFTRQYILQMAVDSISKHFDSNFKKSDFLSNKHLGTDKLVTVAEPKNDSIREFVKLSIWQNRFHNLLNYLIQLVFPIFENYFFITLWNYFKESSTYSTDAEIAILMYESLRDYLNTPEVSLKLFSSEDVFISKDDTYKSFDRQKIIKPHFASNGLVSVDTALYKQCLVAHTLSFKEEHIPDFINLKYLQNISTNLDKKIQNLYILECIN